MRLSHLLAASAVLLSTALWASAGRAEETLAAVEAENAAFSLFIPGIGEVQAVAGGEALTADIILNQSVSGNVIDEDGISHRSAIEGSFSGGRGLLNVNQDSGNANNQANVRVVAFAAKDAGIQVLEIDAALERENNTVVPSEGAREDRLVDSFNDTVGVVGINQSSGNANQQANLLVVGIGLMVGSEALLLGDHALETLFPEAPDPALLAAPSGPRTETVSDSFQNFNGVAQVTQSAGDLNVMQNVLGVSIAVMGSAP